VASNDITQDERVDVHVRQALMRSGFRGGIICLPLIFKERIMGVVNFIYREPHILMEAKRRTYLAIGRTIALALANADYVARIEEEISERKRAQEALVQSVQEMGALNTLARKAGKYLSVDQVVEATIESLHSLLELDVLLIYLLEGEELILKGMHKGETVPGVLGEEDLDAHLLGDCLCGLSAREGKSLFSLDIHSDPRCTRQECRSAGLRSFAALPLLSADRVVGLLGLGSCREYDYNNEASFLETVSRQVAVSLVNAMLYEQIRTQAEELEKRVVERTAELEIAMQKAREADMIKSAFLASMSHELRTPLNSIIGFTGILLQGLAGGLNDEQRKQLGMVQNSARHLLRLINDVLDISKIEAGQLELSRERFDLAEALTRVIQIVSPLAEKKGLTISREITPEALEINSDRRRVEQILINLINNGVKFTSRGGVHIACRSEGSQIVVAVIDTGIGIKPEDMGTLFEAFRQIHTGVARPYEGTGLGLSICKKLVGMLGGEIRVESEGEGGGSTFIFTLPVGSEVEYEYEAKSYGHRG
jgi:signal transduction histidine kinase